MSVGWIRKKGSERAYYETRRRSSVLQLKRKMCAILFIGLARREKRKVRQTIKKKESGVNHLENRKEEGGYADSHL